jgi:CheY-like chemotaxis protein
MAAQPHILVVDNEPALTEVIKDILEADGYRVSVANDVRTALRLAGELPPTLVLSDIMMPGLSGLDLLSELRRIPSLAAVPVIFFTASQDGRRARQLGAWDVIRKPASRQHLLDKVFGGVAVGFMSQVHGDVWAPA